MNTPPRAPIHTHDNPCLPTQPRRRSPAIAAPSACALPSTCQHPSTAYARAFVRHQTHRGNRPPLRTCAALLRAHSNTHHLRPRSCTPSEPLSCSRPVCAVWYYRPFSRRIGKSNASRIDGRSSNVMQRRSTPKPQPAQEVGRGREKVMWVDGHGGRR